MRIHVTKYRGQPRDQECTLLGVGSGKEGPVLMVQLDDGSYRNFFLQYVTFDNREAVLAELRRSAEIIINTLEDR